LADLELLSLERRVEALLAPFAAPGTPGCAVGVVRDGALVLHRQAGLASLEFDLPVGPDTTFRIASVSKQFTCAAILMLAAEGRLAVTDAVQAHLPELPDLGAPIALDHLMRNSSGLRDMLELMRMGGADLAQPCGTEDLLAAIARQRSLNFAPGSRFCYCNSGFFLLGLVVERIAGEALGAFLARRVFGPLGMTRTRMATRTTEVVPGLATGYLPQAGDFVRAAHGFPLGGEGGLVSCVEDLAIWAQACETGRVIGAALAAALAERRPFHNGALNLYARGLEAGEHRGLGTLNHGGLWPGYKTCFLRAPERRLAIVAIANHGGADPHRLAHQVLDAALEGTLAPAPRLPERAALERLAGRWLQPESGTVLEIEIELDPAREPVGRTHGVPFALAPTADGRLTARRGSFCFTLRERDGGLEVERDAGIREAWHRAPEPPPLPDGIEGVFACAELATRWEVARGQGGGAVTVRGPHVAAGPWRLEPIAPDLLRLHTPSVLYQGWLDIRLRRDPHGGIAALAASGARAWNLVFDRVA